MDANTVHILLVEDNPVDTMALEEMLAEGGRGRFRVESFERLTPALERLGRGGIDIVITDLSLPDCRGIETLERTHAKAPHVPIIIMTGLDDDGVAMKGMAAGAQDYLVKGQIETRHLVRSILYSVQRSRAQTGRPPEPAHPAAPAGRVIGFIGAKGGVGTTTVALNVAALLTQRQKTVAAVELRGSWGSFAHQLRQEPGVNLSALGARAAADISGDDVSRAILQTGAGFKALFAPQQPGEFHALDADQAEAVVKLARHAAEYLVLDLESAPTPANRAALALCDMVVLVSDREPGSLRAARAMLDLFRAWDLRSDRFAAAVVNRSALMPSPTAAEITAQINCPILGMLPSAADMLDTSKTGIPVAVSRPDSILASALADITGRLAEEAVAVGR